MDVTGKLRELLRRDFAAPRELRDDDPLLETGVIDSTDIFRLIARLESEFTIKFQPREFRAASFRSIDSIAALVGGKLGRKK